MPLTGASARFHTNDDDKDDDTALAIYVDGPMGRVAQVEGIRGKFNDHTDNGPFALTIVRSIQRWELASCRTRVHIDPNGHDTWRFNYELDLAFSDAPSANKNWNGIALDQDNRDFSDGLG
jgi:hypothetical protein